MLRNAGGGGEEIAAGGWAFAVGVNEAIGTVAAVLAGASFAAGGVLQQRAAARAERRDNAARLVAALLRRPEWLAGIALAVVSNGLEALALAFAPLAVVQPLLVSELIFAIPVSARLVGVRLGIREWAALVAVAAGLAAALWGTAPSGGSATGSWARWLLVGGALAGTACVLATVGRRRTALVRASCYAAAAALVFAVSSALMAATVHGFATTGFDGFARPAPYAMAVASISGLLLIQSAYQAGPLAVTMPMVDWVEPIVAVLLGVSVLGESIDTQPVHVAVVGLGALAALAGIVRLDRSPGVRQMQRHQGPTPTAQLVSSPALAGVGAVPPSPAALGRPRRPGAAVGAAAAHEDASGVCCA